MIKVPAFVEKLTQGEAYCQGFHDGMIEKEMIERARQDADAAFKKVVSEFKFIDEKIEEEEEYD